MVKKYAVVGFTNEKEETVEIIPTNWLIGSESCLWPTAKDTNKTKIKWMIKECVAPSSSWLTFAVRVFGYSNSFIRASEKTEQARSFSSVGSDSSDDEFLKERVNVNKRASNVPTRFRDSTDEETYLPPVKKRCRMTLKELKTVKAKYTLPESPKEDVVNEVPTTEDQLNMSSNACKSPSQTLGVVQPSKQICSTPSTSFSQRNEDFEQRMSLLDATPSSSRNLDLVQANTLLEPLLQKVLRNLMEIRHEQKEMRKEMKKMREKMDLKSTISENPEAAAAISGIMESGHEFLNLPLSSVEQLKVLEEEITKDRAKATSLARFLCRGGGFANANNLTLLVMKRLLSREVALLYSLEGRQKKLKFSDLNLFNVVIASVKIKFEDAATAVLSNRIGKALAGSFDWDGKRTERQKKEASESHILFSEQ